MQVSEDLGDIRKDVGHAVPKAAGGLGHCATDVAKGLGHGAAVAVSSIGHGAAQAAFGGINKGVSGGVALFF